MKETQMLRKAAERKLSCSIGKYGAVDEGKLREARDAMETIIGLEETLRAYKRSEATCDELSRDDIATKLDAIQSNFDAIYERVERLEAEERKRQQANLDFLNGIRR